MELKSIRPLGIDRQDTDDVSMDGSCEYLRGFIPSGSINNPQWRVNWMGEKIAVSLWSSGDRFLNAHISNGVLFLFVKISTNYYELWRVTKTTTTYDTKVKLWRKLGNDSNIWECQFREVKEGFYWSLIPTTSGERSRLYFYSTNKEVLIPNVVPLLDTGIYITQTEISITEDDYQNNFTFNGFTDGFLKNTDKYYAFIVAAKLKNGLRVRQSQPIIQEVAAKTDASNRYAVNFNVNTPNSFYSKIGIESVTGTFQYGENIRIDAGVFDVATYGFSNDAFVAQIVSLARDLKEAGHTITGQTSGATATTTGVVTPYRALAAFTEDTRYYLDQVMDGVFTRPDESASYIKGGSDSSKQDAMAITPIQEYYNEQIDAFEVFMTQPRATKEEAINESVYYYVASLENIQGQTSKIAINEEILATREVLEQDPFSYHWLAGHSIHDLRNRLVIGGVYNNFSVPLLNFLANTSPGSPGTERFVAVVKIIKGGTPYYVTGQRNNIMSVTGSSPNRTVTLPDFLSYPDRDAVSIDLYWFNDTNYELAKTYSLRKHPGLNLAISENGTFTYDEGDATAGAIPTYSEVHYYEQEEFKVGDLQKGYFPLTQSYKVDSNDQILGVATNLDEPSDGQFGEYPLYVICDKGIYGARQGDGVLFSKIDKIDEEHGLYNRKCFTVKNGYLWGAGNGRIWVLRGSSVEDIHYPLLLNRDNTDLLPIEAVGRLITQEAVIFAGAKENFVYDLRYKAWYSYKPKGIDHVSATGDIAGRVFFESDSEAYELANLIPDDVDQSDDAIVNLDSQTKSTEDVSVYLKTKPIKLDLSLLYKRLKSGVLRGKFVIADGDTLTITLYGVRSTHNDPIKLIEYTESPSGSSTTKNNIVLRSYGSFQSYILQIQGTLVANSDSYIEDMIVEYFVKSSRLKL